MNVAGFAAVAIGAVLGAWLRWGLSTWLNPANPNLPLGTLAANIGGGYAIGIAVAFFSANASIAPEWRLVCITGFLGALTTFSTFSAESVELMMAGRYGAAAIHTGAHLFGSIAATVLGIVTYRTLT
jgi:CrcB protein